MPLLPLKLFLSLSILLMALSAITPSRLDAQPGPGNQTGMGFERYYERTEFLLASPGALKFGLYGYDNPALLQYLHQTDFAFHWTSNSIFEDNKRRGVFFGFPGSSFSFVHNEWAGQTYRDYRIALGGGTDAAAIGMGFNWYRGDTDLLDLKSNFTLGAVMRPIKQLSIGLTGTSTFKNEYHEAVADVAFRPMGTPILTLFGDYALDERSSGVLDGLWSAGAAVEVLPGLRLTGRYIENAGFTAGVQFSFGRGGLSYQSHMDRDGYHRFNSWSIRAGAMDRNVYDSYFRKDRNFVSIDVSGSIPYQKFLYFDQRPTYLSLLDHLHEAARDPSVAGVVVNTTRMQVDHAKTWEIREALMEIRAAGKNVVVYIERGGMNVLHLASAANYVVMDP